MSFRLVFSSDKKSKAKSHNPLSFAEKNGKNFPLNCLFCIIIEYLFFQKRIMMQLCLHFVVIIIEKRCFCARVYVHKTNIKNRYYHEKQ
ncbi:MAG: hypothetical protein CSA05_03165 [Bacteroidia bacterium]|nr:MAG: hypothetical protein CSA05_03165 [Bacteroidia bacterium]